MYYTASLVAVLAAVATLTVVSASAFVDTPSGPIAQTTQGAVQGTYQNNSRKFLGIPFAAPPVGQLRWQPPQPPASWTGVRQAVNYGSPCVQPPDAFTMFAQMSEDCLFLNVYAPKHNDTNLAVMVFLYGGSWKYGSSNFLAYDAVTDVDLAQDVIFVTLNYRLGPFGFLGSDELKANSTDGSTGNYGLQDQRAALQWVKENIANFNGDPEKVMLFGESAGAGSTSAHLVAKKSWGLYSRAAMESGPIAPWTAQPYEFAVDKFNGVAQNLGCMSESNNGGTATANLDCMRNRNWTAVQDATHGIKSGFLEWSPVIDGVEFTEHPMKLAAAGEFNRVPVLMGSNRDEGTLFVGVKPDVTQADALQYCVDTFGQNLTDMAMTAYKWSDYPSPYWMLSHIVGDSMMTCSVRNTARWLTAPADAAPVYTYFFQHELEAIQLFKPDIGVCHASELALVFDLEVALWGKGEPQLADQTVFYWTRFAWSGNPNTPVDHSHGSPPPPMVHWPSYNATGDANLVLDIPLATQTGLKSALCDFWDKHPLGADIVFGGKTN